MPEGSAGFIRHRNCAGFSTLLIILLFFTSAVFADEKVIDKELTVIRGDYKEVHYLIPENSDPIDLEGSFKAKGGLNDDVSFLVLPKDQYVRWYSNYPHKAIVKFEKKKEGKFRFATTPGETYYFVFDNFFSTVSNKQVKIEVKAVPPEKK
jgi:hypothetical protein